MNLLVIIEILCVILICLNPVAGLGVIIAFLYYVYLNQRNEKNELIKLFYTMKGNTRTVIRSINSECQWNFSVNYRITVWAPNLGEQEWNGSFLEMVNKFYRWTMK